jgi:hypothetical protein
MFTILLIIGMTASAAWQISLLGRATFPKAHPRAMGGISVLFGSIANLLILAQLSGRSASTSKARRRA